MKLVKLLFTLNLFVFSIGQIVSTDVLSSNLNQILNPIKSLPIQDGGRVKPFDTFAREALSMIYGKPTYEGRPAVEVILTWLLQPQAWEEKELIEIRYNLVKRALKFDESKKYFTIKAILENDRLSMLMQELQSKRDSKAKLDPYFQALQRLEGQIGFFRGVVSGELIRMVPAQPRWQSINEWDSSLQKSFGEINKDFIEYLGLVITQNSGDSVQQLAEKIKKDVEQFKLQSQKVNPELYPEEGRLTTEVSFNEFHPFQKAWIFYFLAVVALGLIWIIKNKWFYRVGWILSIIGLMFHLYGFVLRIYLSGRPPVSNMYETVVWVAFGAIVFAMAIEAIYKWQFILLAGTIVSGFCLLLADFAPVILDPTLQPLEAVLNSNFWLTTHVLTITISYAAFFLAFALGDIGLFLYFKGLNEDHPKIKAITLSIYRAMQIGVVLLAPGIILGGIWADYSWGRFWGWDPKETWALIALLGYIGVLHGRIAGLIKSFGLVVSAIVTFSLVIMAWYGVNYILGAGLHSYGFGAGGVEYVAFFVGIHIIAVVFVSFSRKKMIKS